MPERFLIYNASAGAGKTYQLVRNFLKICLGSKDPLRFIQVLAITFTNKAAREMKVRLLSQLKLLRAYPEVKPEAKTYTEELAQELGIAPEELKFRAESALSGILHHYAAFGVSTIDSFTNRLIRSFSKDLDLNNSFTVELEEDRIIDESIDRLFETLNESDRFTEVLSRYIERQLELEKGTNARGLLQMKGKELFRERAFPFLERLAEIDSEHLLSLEASLKKRQEELVEIIQKPARRFFEEFEKQGLTIKHFKHNGLAFWVQKVLKGNFVGFTPTQEKNLNAGPDDIASVKGKKEGALTDPDQKARFFQLQMEVIEVFRSHFETYFILDRVLNSIYPLSLLGAMESHIEAIKEETGRIPIGDFNKIISRELRDQPAPFLYERIGERYADFFIDEFQDTSRLQWENMLPLINNAMASEGNSAMLVGDAKQSIYRFRGGDLQLFVDLFNDKDPSNKSEAGVLYERKVIQMGQNWRSKANLVNFNNTFFTALSQKLPNPEYRDIYAKGEQEAARPAGGKITLELIESKEHDEEHEQALLLQINDLLSRGYCQRDICILARSNKTCTAAAAFLMEHEQEIKLKPGEHLQILSADSLVVGASKEVRALISFLQTIEQPKNKELRRDWISLAFETFAADTEDPHTFRSHLAQANLTQLWEQLQAWVPEWNAAHWLAQDLLERCYLWMRYFQVDWQQDPYLQFFLDQVSEYLGRNRPVNSEFIEWWLDKGQKKSVGLPESTNAIQIMSIHKSKGLEFPVVLVLDAVCSLDSAGGGGKSPSTWVELDPELYGLDFTLVDLIKPPAADFQPQYTSWYDEEVSRVMMDNLNIYYVAFTRAERELIIFSKMPPKKGTKIYLESELLRQFEANEPGRYIIGEASPVEEPKKGEVNYHLSSFKPEPWNERLETISSAPRNWRHDQMKEARRGSLMHELLARLEHPRDLELILKRASDEAWMNKQEEEKLAADLKALFHNPVLEALFHPEAKVYNERSILIPSKGRRIPDRLCEWQGKWYLADYKTGLPLPTHREQLKEYAELLAEADIPVEQAFLIYLGEDLKIEEVSIWA